MQDSHAQIENTTLKANARILVVEKYKEKHDILLTFQATQQQLEEKEQELKEAQQGKKNFELKMDELAWYDGLMKG